MLEVELNIEDIASDMEEKRIQYLEGEDMGFETQISITK